MENASEALIMAGQVLIFIIALTICISSFSTVREGINSIISHNESIEFAKDSEGYINFIESKDDKAVRIVGADAVVSSLYRARSENYRVYIKFKGESRYIKLYNGSKPPITDKDFYSKPYTLLQDDNYYKSKIKGKKFKEYIGEYQDETADSVASENKETFRIITYIEV